MIVADTGPIIAFARIGRLALLRRVLNKLLIPNAVYNELVGHGGKRNDPQELGIGVWIHQKGIHDAEALAQVSRDLGNGEREAIILAKESGARLFVDDQKARRVAIDHGIQVVGSLWVLGEGKHRDFIPATRPLVEELRSVGYWMHEERIVRPFLKRMGEDQ